MMTEPERHVYRRYTHGGQSRRLAALILLWVALLGAAVVFATTDRIDTPTAIVAAALLVATALVELAGVPTGDLRTFCSWCGSLMVDGPLDSNGTPSHGCCHRCRLKHFGRRTTR